MSLPNQSSLGFESSALLAKQALAMLPRAAFRGILGRIGRALSEKYGTVPGIGLAGTEILNLAVAVLSTQAICPVASKSLNQAGASL